MFFLRTKLLILVLMMTSLRYELFNFQNFEKIKNKVLQHFFFFDKCNNIFNLQQMFMIVFSEDF